MANKDVQDSPRLEQLTATICFCHTCARPKWTPEAVKSTLLQSQEKQKSSKRALREPKRYPRQTRTKPCTGLVRPSEHERAIREPKGAQRQPKKGGGSTSELLPPPSSDSSPLRTLAGSHRQKSCEEVVVADFG